MTIIIYDDISTIDHMTKLWLSYRTTNLWRFMIIIIFFENMVIDAFLACLFNVHYLIFLFYGSWICIFLWIYLEIGLLRFTSGTRHVIAVATHIQTSSEDISFLPPLLRNTHNYHHCISIHVEHCCFSFMCSVA